MSLQIMMLVDFPDRLFPFECHGVMVDKPVQQPVTSAVISIYIERPTYMAFCHTKLSLTDTESVLVYILIE